jgi:hypothetical protein
MTCAPKVFLESGSGWVPSLSGISCVEGVGVSDEVGTVVRVFMMVEYKEVVFRVDLRPAVTFVVGLPHGVIHEKNQNSFCLGRCQNERDTASIGQLTLRFLK